MPRSCTICTHSDRQAVDHDLLAGTSSFRDIARQYGVSKDAVARHRADHLPAALARTHEAQELARSGALVDQVREHGAHLDHLYTSAVEILEEAREPRTVNGTTVSDHRTALNAINTAITVKREGRSHLELVGKITGELSPPPSAPGGNYIRNIQVLVMPKTPEADRTERERVARMTPEQKANYINSLRSLAAQHGGGLITSACGAELLRESD